MSHNRGLDDHIQQVAFILQGNEVIGIDLGLTTFARLSDGQKIERQRWFKGNERNLKRLQRKVSALPKGRAERSGAMRALNHVHQRIANRHCDFAHQQSQKLIDSYQSTLVLIVV